MAVGITAPQLSEDVQFAHAFHWDVKFEGYDGSFFPATGINETLWTFTNSSVEFGPITFTYPSSAMVGGFQVQAIETDDWSIVKWLQEWRDEVFDESNFTVGLIDDCARRATLYKLGWQKNIVIEKEVWIIPSSNVDVQKASTKNDTINFSVSFDVVGIINDS